MSWLKALVGVCVLASVFRGVNFQSQAYSKQWSLEPPKLNNPRDVAAAIAHAKKCERAAILVHVNWSTDSFVSSARFLEFSRGYKSIRGLPDIGLHCIDCTSLTDNYAPLRQLDGWEELEMRHGSRRSLLYGYGEIVWLENGKVLAVDGLPWSSTPADVLLRALQVYDIHAP